MSVVRRESPRSRRRGGIPLVLSLLLLAGLPAYAGVQYVNAAASDPHNGLSWATAFTTVQQAVDAAATSDQIWVAKGEYASRVVIAKGVSLYGGFIGSETDLAQRDWRANSTVLNAAVGDPAVTTSGTAAIRIDGFTLRGPGSLDADGLILSGSACAVANCNLYELRVGVASSALTATVIGSTFRGCDTSVEGTAGTLTMASCVVSACGTGVNSSGALAVKVFNNTILNNEVGLANCQAFSNNIIAWNGTGVAAYAGTPTYNCVYGNGSDWGSSANKTGISGNFSGDPMLAAAGSGNLRLLPGSPCIGRGDKAITLPTTLDADGQPRVQGTGVDIGAYESNGQAPVVKAQFIHISASGNDANDGATWSTAKRTLRAAVDAAWGNRTEIWVKSGVYDGGVTIDSAIGVYGGFAGDESVRLQRHGPASVLTGRPNASTLNVISNASPATVDGFDIRGGDPGIACTFGSTTVSNCTVAGCVDGIAVYDGAPFIVNNTISANAHGVYFLDGVSTLANTIVAFNSCGLWADPDGTATVSLANNCAFGNGTDYDGIPDPTGQNGNIKADPLLASSTLGNLHIQPGSPCIDAGDDIAALLINGKDKDGQWRIGGAHVDVGADEADGTTWTTVPLVLRVDGANGDDTHDGTSWAEAKRTVLAAFNALGGAGGEVWVAEGTYPAAVVLPAFTGLYGGFAGTETDRSARDSKAHPTLLGGDPGEDAVTIAGGTTTGTLDGFTIWNAYRGIVCSDSSPVIAHNVITGSAVAVDVTSGSPNLSFNTIRANSKGIDLNSGSPTVANNVMTQQAIRAISCYSGSATIRNNAITGNGGTAVTIAGATASIIGNTIMGAMTGIVVETGANVTAANNIVAYNMTGVTASGNALTSVSLKSNDIFGNGVAVNGLSDPVGTDGNIAVEPSFASPVYGEVHLLPGSGVIGVGDPSMVAAGETDFDGAPRMTDGKVDIGADQADGQAHTATPRIVRVSAHTGSDSNDGSSWASAMKTIQAGVMAATTTGGEVWVADGTYPEQLSLKPFVYVYGGFIGTETDRASHPPIPGGTVLDGTGLPTTVKVRGGFTFSGMDGVTVTNSRLGVSAFGGAAALTNNRLVNNPGIGISETGGASNISHNVFANNASGGVGFAVTTQASFASITGNFLTANGAGNNTQSGAISITDGAPLVANNLVSASPVGIYSSGAATMVNNTIVGNRYGAYLLGLTGSPPYANTLKNNIIAGSTSAGVYRSGVTITAILGNNDVFGGPIKFSGLADPTGQNGNISADPLFVTAGNYRLAVGSPAIDAGDNTATLDGWTDLDGKPRIAGALVDMGAYEYSASILTLADAVRAVRIAGGLTEAVADDVSRLDVLTSGAPGGNVSLADAARLLREAEGLDP